MTAGCPFVILSLTDVNFSMWAFMVGLPLVAAQPFPAHS
jgi:hypothetical protein